MISFEFNEEIIAFIFLFMQLVGSFIALFYILINSHLQNKKRLNDEKNDRKKFY